MPGSNARPGTLTQTAAPEHGARRSAGSFL